MLTSKEQGNGQDTVQSGQRPAMHLAEAVKAYGRIELELIKLQAVQAATRVLAMMALRVAVIALSFLFVLLLSMGAGLLIGDMLGKPHYGLLIVASFYLLLIVIVSFVLGGWIRRQAGNAIMKALLK